MAWDRERYPYLATVRWEKNSPLTLLVQNREQTEELLLAADSATGVTTELLKETDPAWVNIDSTMPCWLKDGRSFLWSTERSGAWQLERRNRDGSLARALTRPETCYRALAGIDEQRGMAYFVGGDDPTQSQLFSVSLQDDGARPRQITTKHGLHSAIFGEHGGTHIVSEQSLEGEIHHRVFRPMRALLAKFPTWLKSRLLRRNLN